LRTFSKARTHNPERQALHDSVWRLDSGFSSALGLAAITATGVLLTALGLAVSLGVMQVKTQLLADTAALTTVDTQIGAIAGYPCENAELIAGSNGAILTECRIVGLGAQIELSQSLGLLEIFGWAEAKAR
jgi:hypothetical protein